MQLTADLIKGIAPKARDDYVAALVNGGATFEKYGFTTPMRMAMFLAECCEETGGLTIVREATNYTARNLLSCWPAHFTEASAEALARQGGRAIMNTVYGPSMAGKALGNAGGDDGYNFRGGSFAQTTGRDNYRTVGKAIGVDLENHPELIEDPAVGLQAACFELSKYLDYMDLGGRGLKAVSNGLNRGNPHSSLDPIGWPERQRWFEIVCGHLGINPTDASDLDLIWIGNSGPLVLSYQMRLAALHYDVGDLDGFFGLNTRAAVLAFQTDNGLDADGKIGPKTRAALVKATADIPVPSPSQPATAPQKEPATMPNPVPTTSAPAATPAAVKTATQSATVGIQNFTAMLTKLLASGILTTVGAIATVFIPQSTQTLILAILGDIGMFVYFIGNFLHIVGVIKSTDNATYALAENLLNQISAVLGGKPVVKDLPADPTPAATA